MSTEELERGFDADDYVPFAEDYDEDEDDEGLLDFESSGIDDVEPEDACPNCGETRVDWLSVDADGRAECLACGARWRCVLE